jgi:hypothetical protein
MKLFRNAVSKGYNDVAHMKKATDRNPQRQRERDPAGPPAPARSDHPGQRVVIKFCTLTERTQSVKVAGEDSTPVPPDRSGWTSHPSERRDFLHRIRVFPPEVASWRKQFIRHLEEHPTRFRHAPGMGDSQYRGITA